MMKHLRNQWPDDPTKTGLAETDNADLSRLRLHHFATGARPTVTKPKNAKTKQMRSSPPLPFEDQQHFETMPNHAGDAGCQMDTWPVSA